MKKIYVSLEAVAELVDLGESTIQKMCTTSEFPAPRMLTGRRVGWLVREVEEWAEQRPISNLLPPPNTGKKRKTRPEQDSPNLQQAA